MSSRFVIPFFLRFWKQLYLDTFTFYGGGGSPPPAQPVQQTVQQSNIPEYAQPYVESMLGTAQQQIYNVSPSGQITGMKPYTPYSTNPTDYVAPFSPLQQQAQQGIANLQVPAQYQQAMGMTGIAGAQTEAAAGAGMQAGMGYGQQATNPNAVQAYMNPYVQESLAPQLQLLQQQAGVQGAQEQSAATSSGAFGGTREALANALQRQNANLAAQQAIGQGYNTAYNQAQANMQQAAALGMQGAGMGMQGAAQYGNLANQLAGLGGQRLQAQQGIYGLQAQTGATQQQQQQNIINQAVQNYATAQQWPYQQLAFMSGLLRGLPLQSTTTSEYVAPPSMTSQVAGMGIAGLGLSNALSDDRTKQNISFFKSTPDGYNIYVFEYKPEFKAKFGTGFFRGVMASEVEKVMPKAVFKLPNGYKAVNYGMLGISMERV